jgi:hypothetical protein
VNFRRSFRRYLIVLGLFMLGNSSNLFLLMRVRELGLPQAQVPLLWATMSGVAAIFLTPLSPCRTVWEGAASSSRAGLLMRPSTCCWDGPE